jgi:outer membrane lipoprotein SlyB
MTRFGLLGAVALLLAGLSGCAHPSQNRYDQSEVGKTTAVSFGTVLAVRPIDITGKNTGLGMIGGAGAGGLAGSQIGAGSGNAFATLGGVVVGAVAGGLAEQALSDRTGVEYTITLESGVTLTVAQEAPKDERVMQPGERVMVQNSGGYQRVLPASQLPTEIKRPQGVKVVD